MDELEEIRRKKIEEMRQRYNQQTMQQAQEEDQVQQQLSQIEAVVRQRLTKDALSRYSNIKAADPEKAVQLLLLLAQLLQSGRLRMIDDNMMKDILLKAAPKKREMKIKRI